MKIIKSETFFEGAMYDRLFVLEEGIVPIDRLFDHYIISYGLKRMDPIENLPIELATKIVLKTIISLLKDFHFSDAMELIAINRYMIHHFYYAIFGKTQASLIVKHRRLSRIMHLARNLYDTYFSSYACFDSPTVLLEYESEFMVGQRSVFYPWSFEPHVSVIQVDHVQENAGLSFILGENYGDKGLLIGAYEKQGILHGEKLAFPFVHFILMDAFQFLNVFENPETKYHFDRFSMFLKAIFGKYCKIFYFSEKIPYSQVDTEEEYAYIFENQYLFKESAYCVRK
jgi:hypothetical protein